MSSGVRAELVGCQAVLEREIADKRMTRDDVASTYAMTLLSSERDSVDWLAVNGAIIERWSLSALKYIKEKAWRMARRRAK